MSAQIFHKTKSGAKALRKRDLDDNLKLSAMKASTDDSSLSPLSTVAADLQHLSSLNEHASQSSDLDKNHRFNLRDRNKMTADKKNEAFVFYN